MLVTIIAWIVLGAIAGYLAGFLVKGDEGFGVIGHVILGIIGALVGGFVANLLGFGTGREGGDVINIQSIIVAVIGAVIVVVIAGFLQGGRAGRGPVLAQATPVDHRDSDGFAVRRRLNGKSERRSWR